MNKLSPIATGQINAVGGSSTSFRENERSMTAAAGPWKKLKQEEGEEGSSRVIFCLALKSHAHFFQTDPQTDMHSGGRRKNKNKDYSQSNQFNEQLALFGRRRPNQQQVSESVESHGGLKL
jgi:hypothetical protein